jgi:hypothetical protein
MTRNEKRNSVTYNGDFLLNPQPLTKTSTMQDRKTKELAQDTHK